MKGVFRLGLEITPRRTGATSTLNAKLTRSDLHLNAFGHSYAADQSECGRADIFTVLSSYGESPVKGTAVAFMHHASCLSNCLIGMQII
jgi:hypothetical protein